MTLVASLLGADECVRPYTGFSGQTAIPLQNSRKDRATRTTFEPLLGAVGLEGLEAVAGKQIFCFHYGVAGLTEFTDQFIFRWKASGTACRCSPQIEHLCAEAASLA